MKATPIALEDREASGARLQSPSAGRNKRPIANRLAELLPVGAEVLGIASGTGEHAHATLQERPDLSWQPSDPDRASRASQDAWASDFADWRMRPSLDLDTTRPHWWGGLPDFDAVFCANMIHIAPWEAAGGLARGAVELLRRDGLLVLYGPFLKGAESTEGNRAFDASLRDRDPRWGVRELVDVKLLFAKHGLALGEAFALPANNDLLVFSRAGRPPRT